MELSQTNQGANANRKRKRALLPLDELPPIEFLDPKELKSLSREQLYSYLYHNGVQANLDETKPTLKHKLRTLISNSGFQRTPSSQRTRSSMAQPTTPLVFRQSPQAQDQRPSPAQQQPDGQPHALQVCNLCHLSISTPGCLFQCCTLCCLNSDFSCPIHQQRKTGPETPSTPSSRAIPTPRRTATPSTPQPQPARPVQPAPASSSLPKFLQIAECPACKKMVPFSGSTFFVHLKRCNPRFLLDHFLRSNDFQFKFDTHTQETPFDVVKQNAKKRFLDTQNYIQELFSSSSIDELWNTLPPVKYVEPEAIEKKLISFEQNLETILQNMRELVQQTQEDGHQFQRQVKKLKASHAETTFHNSMKDSEEDGTNNIYGPQIVAVSDAESLTFSDDEEETPLSSKGNFKRECITAL